MAEYLCPEDVIVTTRELKDGVLLWSRVGRSRVVRAKCARWFTPNCCSKPSVVLLPSGVAMMPDHDLSAEETGTRDFHSIEFLPALFTRIFKLFDLPRKSFTAFLTESIEFISISITSSFPLASED